MNSFFSAGVPVLNRFDLGNEFCLNEVEIGADLRHKVIEIRHGAAVEQLVLPPQGLGSKCSVGYGPISGKSIPKNTGLKIETQLPEVPVTQTSTPSASNIRHHHSIRLPPAVLLRAGMDANIMVGVSRRRMVAGFMVAHQVKDRLRPVISPFAAARQL